MGIRNIYHDRISIMMLDITVVIWLHREMAGVFVLSSGFAQPLAPFALPPFRDMPPMRNHQGRVIRFRTLYVLSQQSQEGKTMGDVHFSLAGIFTASHSDLLIACHLIPLCGGGARAARRSGQGGLQHLSLPLDFARRPGNWIRDISRNMCSFGRGLREEESEFACAFLPSTW